MNDSTTVFLFKVITWSIAMGFSLYSAVVVYGWLIMRMIESSHEGRDSIRTGISHTISRVLTGSPCIIVMGYT